MSYNTIFSKRNYPQYDLKETTRLLKSYNYHKATNLLEHELQESYVHNFDKVSISKVISNMSRVKDNVTIGCKLVVLCFSSPSN